MTMDTHWSLDHYEDPPGAEQACDKLLSPLQTLFGRLVTLSSLRVSGSENYHCAEFKGVYTSEVTTRILRRRHELVFRKWLSLRLDEQQKDLSEFLASDAANLSSPAPLKDASVLIPAAAVTPERTLFLDELSFVLALIDRD